MLKYFILSIVFAASLTLLSQEDNRALQQYSNNELIVGSWNLISWEYKGKIDVAKSDFTKFTFHKNHTLVVTDKNSTRQGRWSWFINSKNEVSNNRFYVIMKDRYNIIDYKIVYNTKDTLILSNLVGKEESYYKFFKNEE